MKSMKKHFCIGALAALSISGMATSATASSHREAPAISNDPAADNTDLWAWVAPGAHDKVYIVASYIPLEEPSGGPNYNSFSDEVLYEIHIARGNSSLGDAFTYQISFKTDRGAYVSQKDVADTTKPLGGGKEFFSQLSGFKQTYTITKIDWTGTKPVVTEIVKDAPVAPPNIGPRTDAVAYGIASGGTYDDAFAATFINSTSDGGRAFVGPRDDGFYVNIGRIFDLANILSGTAQDNVAGFNCHSIALEIPTTVLAKGGTIPSGASNDNTLGIWASASRRKVRVLRADGSTQGLGPWVQVSRLGFPLINEAVIGIQDKDKYNRTKPATDVANFGSYFLYPIIVRDAKAVGIYTALGVPDATVTKLETGLAGDGKGRLDIIDALNLTNIPASGAHSIPLSATGDVLRLDLGVDSGFPNGRPIPGPAPNKEQADVTDVIVNLVVAGDPAAGITIDGVDHNDKNYLTSFPYLALPWEGFSQAHGK